MAKIYNDIFGDKEKKKGVSLQKQKNFPRFFKFFLPSGPPTKLYQTLFVDKKKEKPDDSASMDH